MRVARSRTRCAPDCRAAGSKESRPAARRPRRSRTSSQWLSPVDRAMSEAVYDAIVAGLGAHGSAATYHLAKRGQHVLGFDRFARGHTLASFGGLSRIIRLSYYEHPSYVPLLKRAWDLWRELEHEVLDSAELKRRYPLFEVDRDWTGLFDAQAGWLAPERSIETHLGLAER